MAKSPAEAPSARLQEQLTELQAQAAEPVSISRKQLLEALGALQESLQELDAVEAELAQQNEELIIAREALERERHRYRELFDLAPVAYLITDAHANVEEANRTAAALFGLSSGLLHGKPLAQMVAAADRLRFRAFLQDLRRSSGVREAEVALEGRRRGRLVLLRVERDEDRTGLPARLRWVLHDITDRKAAEEELRASQERLRHGQRMEAVGRLAGGIAHSFNNLLAAIAFHADLLLEPDVSGTDRRRHAEEIQGAGERAALLARQLLAFSRRQVLQPRHLDVSRNLGDLVPMLRRLVGEGVALEADLDPAAGWIHADLGQVEQVILNLVLNARDAMPAGGRLSLAVAAQELGELGTDLGLQPGWYVRLTVADTGTGMSEEVRSRLFEPFFTTKDRDRGTGLGLSTVYGIVRQSGGAIRVDSEEGQGATFTVYLPQVEAPAGQPEEAVAARMRFEGRGSEVVLLAEDEDNIREPMQEVLEARGYTVLAASNGAQALAAARGWDGPIHLLVSDVVMPGMSGSQLAAQLEQERSGIRVLFISGYSEEAIAPHSVLHTGRSFLQKPFPPSVLLRTVREILDREGRCTAATSS
jgi:PAS domain S-box-containing protein